MAKTLEDILQDVSTYVDQADDTPTGEDLAVRTRLVNRRLRNYGEVYDWQELRTSYKFMPSQASQATLSLPTNFKKLASPLYEYVSTTPTVYTEVSPEEAIENPTENVFYILGNEATGFNLIVPKGLASGTSLMMQIQSFPSSVASLSDNIGINTPEYLVSGVIADVLEGRADERFPIAQSRTDQILANALEKEHTRRSNSGTNTIDNYYARINFRIGE